MDPKIEKLISEVHGLCLARLRYPLSNPEQPTCARLGAILEQLLAERNQCELYWKCVATQFYPAGAWGKGKFASGLSPAEFWLRLERLVQDGFKRVGDGGYVRAREMRAALQKLSDASEAYYKAQGQAQSAQDPKPENEREAESAVENILHFPARPTLRLV